MNPDITSPQTTQPVQPTSRSFGTPQASAFKNAWNYAAQNPNSQFASELRSRIENGDTDVLGAAKAAGMDLSSRVMNKQAVPQQPAQAEASDVGFGGRKLVGDTIGLLSSAGLLHPTIKIGQDLQNQLDQRLQSGQMSQDEYNRLSQGLQPDVSMIAPKMTGEQIIRGGIKAGADIASLGVVPGGAGEIAGAIGKETLGQAIKTGAIEGAKTGATQLGLTGAGEDIQAGGTGIIGGAKGAALGGLTGLATGAATPLIARAPEAISALKGTPKTQEDLINEALSVVQPKLYKKGAVQAIERAGKPGGATQEGIMKTFTREPNQRELNAAKSVAGIVDKKNNVIENATAINSEIGRISQNDIVPTLKKSPSKFVPSQLRSRLNKLEMPVAFKTDPSLERTYQLVKDTAMKVIKNQNPDTMVDGWNARKIFDTTAQKEFGPAVFNPEKNSAFKQALSDVRHTWNDYIAEKSGAGTKFTNKLKDLSSKYDALHNLAESNYKQLTSKSNIFTRAIQKHPEIARGLGISGATLGAEELIRRVFLPH